MLKFISILISFVVAGFLMVHDTWMITVTAFGFQVKTSLITLIVCLVLFFYLLCLLKKPFLWMRGCRQWYLKRKQNQKETFLLLALRTVLDQNSQIKKQLIKQKNNFFDKKSNENMILTALLEPSTHTFEQLIHREGTELAGVRGLFLKAQENGDLTEVNRLLQKALQKYPDEVWVREALWKNQVMLNDWAESLQTLDWVLDHKCLDKKKYQDRKSLLLLKLGRVKEAYKLNPKNIPIVLAYIKEEPNKALSVITDVWAYNPCWALFPFFESVIAGEKTATQMKRVEKLVKNNPENRFSLTALAQVAMNNELWGVAKEHLTQYLNAYPLTYRIAQMMAQVERNGWHHEEEAKKWDVKSLMAQPDYSWGCDVCGHQTEQWDVVCPNCNSFGCIYHP